MLALWELVEACLPLAGCTLLNSSLKDYLWDSLINHNPDITLCRYVLCSLSPAELCTVCSGRAQCRAEAMAEAETKGRKRTAKHFTAATSLVGVD